MTAADQSRSRVEELAGLYAENARLRKTRKALVNDINLKLFDDWMNHHWKLPYSRV